MPEAHFTAGALTGASPLYHPLRSSTEEYSKNVKEVKTVISDIATQQLLEKRLVFQLW